MMNLLKHIALLNFCVICCIPCFAGGVSVTYNPTGVSTNKLQLSETVFATQKHMIQHMQSVDSGDFYYSPSGVKRLNRSCSKVVLRAPLREDGTIDKASLSKSLNLLTCNKVAITDNVVNSWGAAKIIDVDSVFEASKKLKTSGGKMSQSALSGVISQKLSQCRALVAESGAILDPVFVDPNTGFFCTVEYELIICLKDNVNAKSFFANQWKNVRSMPGTVNQFILKLFVDTAEEVLKSAREFAEMEDVLWAEPNMCREGVKNKVLNDTYWSELWHLKSSSVGSVDAQSAWDSSTGADVVIAVIDDGVELTHTDLTANIYKNTAEIAGNGIDDDGNGYVDDVNGWNFFHNNNDPNPIDAADSHGTCVAGIAAAVGNNGKGVAGAAYNAKILPIKISCGESGNYRVTDSQLATAFRYAGGLTGNGWRGADIVNFSWSWGQSTALDTALTDVATRGRNGKGCPIFVSSGNSASEWKRLSIRGIPVGGYTFEWSYSKDNSDVLPTVGHDCVWIGAIHFNSFFPDSSVFKSSGSATWTKCNGPERISTGNGFSYDTFRSGTISNGEACSLSYNGFFEGGTLSYYVRTSAEYGMNEEGYKIVYDGLSFSIDGVEQFSKSNHFTYSPDFQVGYPASHPDTIAVGASTCYDYRSTYSQYGEELDFVAPSSGDGDGGMGYGAMPEEKNKYPLSTDRTGSAGYDTSNYYGFSGTSSASPLAAGVGALVLSKNPNLVATEVRAILRKSCDKIGEYTYVGGVSGAGGRNESYGYGRINAKRALEITPVATPTPAAPVISSATTTDSTCVKISWGAVSGATRYDLYRSTSTTRPSSAYKTNVTSPYSDTGATPGTTYYYWVSAVNSAGVSYSGYKSGKRAETLTISSSSVSASASGKSGTVSVTANCGWTASKNVSWITVSPTSGSGNGTISYTIAANTTAQSRPGTITVASSGGITRTIAVSQEGTDLYTVHFDANGGVGTMDDMVMLLGRAYYLNANKFSRSGYVFLGWSTTPNGKISYRNKEYCSVSSVAGAYITLYAVWAAIDANGFAMDGNRLIGWMCSSNTDVVIPEGVVTIAEAAFAFSNITSIKFPKSLKTIANSVFEGCSSLTNVTFSTGLTSIGGSAFSGCTSLSGVFEFPEGLTSINRALCACACSITDVVLPSTLAELDVQEFLFCSSKLTRIWYKGDAPSVPDGSFWPEEYKYETSPYYGIDSEIVSYVPYGSIGWLDSSSNLPDRWPTKTWENYKSGDIKNYSGTPPRGTSGVALQTHIVSLNVNGGVLSEVPMINVLSGDALGALPVPTRDGYTFLGWFTAVEGGEQVSADTVVTGDMTLYAHWEVVSTAKPNLSIAVFNYWEHGYGIFTTTGTFDGDVGDWPVRTFDVGEEFGLAYGIGNFGEGAINATIGFRIEMVSEADGAVVWYDEWEDDMSLGAYRGREHFCLYPSWTNLVAGLYEMRVVMDVEDVLEEEDEEDNVGTIPFAIRDPLSLSEGLRCDSLVFNTSGDDWYGTRGDGPDGGAVARTEHLGNDATNVLSTAVSGPGILSFDWKVSSEAGYDILSVVVDGETIESVSGTTNGWQTVSIELGEGEHTIEWRYVKDYSYYGGFDCAWLSNVQWEAYADDGYTPASMFDYGVLNGGIVIKKYIGKGAVVNIPPFIDGSPVVSIGVSAFRDCDGLTSITIPNSVTGIGGWAFSYCDGLTSVTIPDSVTSIGDAAFYNCSGLTGVTIPDSVTCIGGSAFGGCSGLTSVTIPDSVTSIGEFAFYDCENLTYAKVPLALKDQVESSEVFYGCSPYLQIEYYGAESLALPVITPADGTEFYEDTCTVTITCKSEGASIYYTTDGTTPRPKPANLYTGPFVIVDTATVKAIAVKGDERTDMVSATLIKRELTLAIAVDAPELTFTTGGDAKWASVLNGSAKVGGSLAQSGALSWSIEDDDPSETWMETIVAGAGTFSFWWKVECEDDPSGCTWDRFEVYTNGVEAARIDGRTEWKKMEFAFADSGTHTVRWRFYKDDWDDEKLTDLAWVDGVVWTSGTTDITVDIGGGKNVVVPASWIDKYGDILAAAGGDKTAALLRTAANGRKVWECFMLGVDPTKANDDFKITRFWMENGKPMFEFSHSADGAGNSFTPRIKTKGKVKLSDGWSDVPTGGNPSFRFFTVEVMLP